jgi:hypothetical protein
MKAIGIVNIILSSLYMGGYVIGLIVMYIEKLIFSSIYDLSYPVYMPFDMNAYFSDLFNMMLVSFPVSIIIYGMLLLGGIKIVKKNEQGIRYTKISSLLIIAWYFVYMAYMYLVLTPYFENMAHMGGIFATIMFIIGGIVGLVFTCGYPVFLLIYFRKPRQFK